MVEVRRVHSQYALSINLPIAGTAEEMVGQAISGEQIAVVAGEAQIAVAFSAAVRGAGTDGEGNVVGAVVHIQQRGLRVDAPAGEVGGIAGRGLLPEAGYAAAVVVPGIASCDGSDAAVAEYVAAVLTHNDPSLLVAALGYIARAAGLACASPYKALRSDAQLRFYTVA